MILILVWEILNSAVLENQFSFDRQSVSPKISHPDFGLVIFNKTVQKCRLTKFDGFSIKQKRDNKNIYEAPNYQALYK